MVKLCIDKILKNKGDPYDLGNQSAGINSHSAIRRKCWNAGQALRIRFLSGEPIVQNKVKEMAINWTNHANLTFQFVNDNDADIRIDFQMNGSWSYIGTDARYISQNQPTMNYGWLQRDTPDSEYYIVLHEFGHALGLTHELQVPASGIPWNKEAVYNYFSSPPYYWNRQIVDQEIFERYNKSYVTTYEGFSNSIMMYYIPQEFLMPGSFEIGPSTALSSSDKKLISTLYSSRIKENEASKDDKRVIMESNNPLEILKLRFAKGEITKDEFLEMRRILES